MNNYIWTGGKSGSSFLWYNGLYVADPEIANSIRVSGILYDPMGRPLAEDTLRFTALNTIIDSIEGSAAEYTSNKDGVYNFSLLIGRYRVEANYDDEYHDLGIIVVDDFTPSPISISNLLLYGNPVVPPIIIQTDPIWANLFADVKATGEHREAQYQVREGANYTSETKELWVSPTAAMADESLESSTTNTQMISQVRTYEDDNLNQAALITHAGSTDGISTYASMEAFKASNGKEEIKLTQVLVGSKARIEDSRHVTDTELEVTKEVTFEGTSIQEVIIADDSSLDQSLTTSVGGSLSERTNTYSPSRIGSPHPQATQGNKLSISEVVNSVTHTAEVNDRQELAISVDELATALREAGIKVYSKEAFQRLTIDSSSKSKQITQVDNYIIQDDAQNPLANFDTVLNKVTINGSLVIANAEDFKGESGDVNDFIYEYSQDNGVTDPWHEDYDPVHPDRWRRQRKTVNGIAVGAWSEGIYLNAKDGRDGDTYFNQYQYSTNDTTRAADSWHVDHVTGDDWRRWRVIENGLPVGVGHEFYGPFNGWFEERMKGSDGPAGWVADLQYQYSVDNLPPWHNDFITGDSYRRERVNWYASNTDFLLKDDPFNPSTPVLAGTWTSGAKIVPVAGEDYGDKYATVMMYKRSNTDLLPSDDPGNVTYSFVDTSITPSPSNGWTANIPEGLEDIWIAVSTAVGLGDTDTIDDWAVEKYVSNGYKSGIGWLYRVTSGGTSLTDLDLPQIPLEYDFLTGKVTGTLGAWSATIPDNITPGDRLWVTFNTALTPVALWVDTLDVEDWETPAIFSQNGYDGDEGSFKSFIFTNAVSIPATPTGGDVNTVPVGWTDDPVNPPEGETTWVSVNLFTFADGVWSVPAWSTPSRYSGTNGIDGENLGRYVTFIYQNAVGLPATPTGGSFDGTTEVFPAGWTDASTSPGTGESTWVSSATYSLSAGVWDKTAWKIPSAFSGVAGSDGDAGLFTAFIFRNAATAPALPTGGTFDGSTTVPPADWTTNPSTPAEGEFTWVATTVYSYVDPDWVHSAWSAPARITGEKGESAGRFTSFVYRNSVAAPATPAGGSFDGTTEVIPTDWTDASSTPPEGESVWVSTSVYTLDGTTWSNTSWSTPTQFTGAPGTDGDAGQFTTFVFKNGVSVTPPTGGSFDGTTQTPPSTWSLTPSTPASGEFTWGSLTTYSFDGTSWVNSGWGTPARHSGEKGEAVGRFVSFVYKNSSFSLISSPPVGGSFNGTSETLPSGWTDASTTPEAGQSTWISSTVYTLSGGIWANNGWKTPAAFSGVPGSDGDSGAYTAFVFKNGSSVSAPGGGSFNGVTLTAPASWTIYPTTPSAGQYTWVSTTIFTFNGSSWISTGWSTPSQHSGQPGNPGANGKDAGRFTSYVYRNYTGVLTTPPSGGSFNGTTEIFPTNWGGTSSTPGAGAATWVSSTLYTYNDVTNSWSNNGWRTPTKFSGEPGVSGTNGAGWYFRNDISIGWFINTELFNWATYGDDLVPLFEEVAGRTVQHGDVFIVSGGSGSRNDTGIYNSGTGKFEDVALQIGGNMVVDGTLAASKIVSGSITGTQISASTTIIAGSGSWTAGLNGNDSGSYNPWRIWAGAALPASAPFRVARDGTTYCTNMNIYGGGMNINNKFIVNSSGVVNILGTDTNNGMTITSDYVSVKVGGVERVRLGLL